MPEIATELEARHVPQGRRDRNRARLLSFEDLDKRRRSAQLVLQVEAAIVSDLGGDLTEVERQLVRRAAILGAVLEDAESKWIEGSPLNLQDYCNATSTLKRICQVIGITRRARPINLLDGAD
jgi:hypothetical protein